MPEFTADLLAKATQQFLQRYPVEPNTASVLRRFADRFVAWATGRPEPYSLLHSDYRLDNLLFAPADANDPVVAVDKLGSAPGSVVVLNSDGKGARDLIGDDKSPVRWFVIGIVDGEGA